MTPEYMLCYKPITDANIEAQLSMRLISPPSVDSYVCTRPEYTCHSKRIIIPATFLRTTDIITTLIITIIQGITMSTIKIMEINIHDKYYGNYYSKHGDGSKYHDSDKYGHTDSYKEHEESKYGDVGKEEGGKYYDSGKKYGHDSKYYEAGGKHGHDSESVKKYSYFASGSGPDGEYKRGYYGSEGYEDAQHKSKYVSDSSGGGYKKGHDEQDMHHKDSYDKYSTDNSGYDKYGKKYESSEHKEDKSYYGSEGENKGWKNSGYDSEYEAHGPKYE
ncbi:hypothetical protein RB195_015346 [Necator americanus]|uniref:Uncharacterized protein n=1 Tax=Necator americanus TaxID=51031 RepID=A0ABR1E446_NECAM